MNDICSLIGDSIFLLFDIIAFSRMLPLKNPSRKGYAVMYGGCAVIFMLYCVATAVYRLPYVISAFMFLSVPSFVLFFILTRYKDARFLLTFCLADIVTYVLTFLVRIISLSMKNSGIAAIIMAAAATLLVFFKSRPYFERYREIMSYTDQNWWIMAASTAIIYITLVFTMAYPTPMIERMEYIPSAVMLCIMIASVILVLMSSIYKNYRLHEQNRQLSESIQWHTLAYTDNLTGVYNRTAYDKAVEKFEEKLKNGGEQCAYGIVIFDINDFKTINDTYGHLEGDEILRCTAKLISEVFGEPGCNVYRIGGDEFAVIAEDFSEKRIFMLLEKLEKIERGGNKFSTSKGYAFAGRLPMGTVFFKEAFSLADDRLYKDKRSRKVKTSK